MTFEEYKQYGEQCATRNKVIGHTPKQPHFIVFTAEEALSSIKNVLSPLIAAELPQIRFIDNGSDNIHTMMNGAFLALKKCQQGNTKEIMAAYQEMYLVALDMFRKFLNDRRMALVPGRPSPECLMKNLQVGDIQMGDVGPVFESYYGWRIDFPYQSTIDSDLDVSKWINETAFTG